MTCFHPIVAWDNGGQIVFNDPHWQGAPDDLRAPKAFKVPCGRCSGCRAARTRMWSLRCMLEASMWEHNIFVTLTFAPEYLPKDGSLDVRHLQLFMKRLRQWNHRYCKKNNLIERKIRFFGCGEYGKQKKRPHYHLLLFNFNFPDEWLWHTSRSGEVLRRSHVLEELWPYGHSTIGEVTTKSAAYVARYVYKKLLGGDEDAIAKWYGNLKPEFVVMSRKPGIGQKFFEKFKKDFYPKDFFSWDEQIYKPPRYFDNLLLKSDPETYLIVKKMRYKNAIENSKVDSAVRLGRAERVLAERNKKLIRGFENE